MQIITVEKSIDIARKYEMANKKFEAIAFYREAFLALLPGVLKESLRGKIKYLGGEV